MRQEIQRMEIDYPIICKYIFLWMGVRCNLMSELVSLDNLKDVYNNLFGLTIKPFVGGHFARGCPSGTLCIISRAHYSIYMLRCIGHII